MFPLLEETRAELCSCLKTIHKAPFSQVISIEDSNTKKGNILFNVNVSSWRNTNGKGQLPYKALPGDIFVILDTDPQTITSDHLESYSELNWAFAWLGQINDNNTPTHLKLHISKNMDRVDVNKSTTLFIVFLMNVTTSLRIWKALQCSVDGGIVKHLLGTISSTVSFLCLKLWFCLIMILNLPLSFKFVGVLKNTFENLYLYFVLLQNRKNMLFDLKKCST